MSTRGTYRFRQRYLPDVTIYIHHSNYPKGAAGWLYLMLEHPSKGGAATQFIRAVPEAEITTSHEDHGDADYCYDIEGAGAGAMVTAYKWDRDGENRKKVCFFAGTLAAFADEYLSDEEGYSRFRLVRLQYSERWFNAKTAADYLNEQFGPLHHLKVWREHGSMGPGAANWDGQVTCLKAVVEEFPELMTEEIGEFLQ